MKPLSRARVAGTLALCTLSSFILGASVLTPRPSAGADSQAVADAQVESAVVSSEPIPILPDSTGSAQQEGGANAKSASDPGQPPDSVAGTRGGPARVSSTDFSGHWVLASSRAVGPGRGGIDPGKGGEWKSTSIWHSGAPVNCGPECTVVQDTATLTISRLGTPDAVTLFDNGVVELRLDGSDTTITETNGRKYIAHANWDGERLVVTHEFECFTSPCTVTQTLSIQDGKLKVVDSFHHVVDSPTHLTLTYEKG